MLRFKQFVGSGTGLEDQVNAWLTEFEPDVTQMVQTSNKNGSVVMSFLFEESFRGQERRFSSEREMDASVAAAARLNADEPIEVEAAPVPRPQESAK